MLPGRCWLCRQKRDGGDQQQERQAAPNGRRECRKTPM